MLGGLWIETYKIDQAGNNPSKIIAATNPLIITGLKNLKQLIMVAFIL
jgi:hypothetical protein